MLANVEQRLKELKLPGILEGLAEYEASTKQEKLSHQQWLLQLLNIEKKRREIQSIRYQQEFRT